MVVCKARVENSVQPYVYLPFKAQTYIVAAAEQWKYRSGTVNSKSFVGKVFLRIKRKFELTYAL